MTVPPPDPPWSGPSRRLFGTSLAARLLRVILGCYLAVAVAVTGAQVFSEYRSAHRRLEADVRAMERTFGEGLADALWNFNTGVLRGILRGVAEMPVVTGAEVRDEHDRIVESVGGADGAKRWPTLFDRPFERRFDLVYTDENRRPHRVGHWIVRSNDGIALDQVKDTLIVILINSLLKTLALLAIFSVVVHRMVGAPLSEIGAFVTGLDARTVGERPLRLRARGDHELHLLAGMFNLMAARLRRAFDDNAALLRDLQEANATLQARVEERTRDLERLAVTDPLTGLGNRRALDAALDAALAEAVREDGEGFSLILADIDHFKAINDRHGHAVGDAVLVALAAVLGDAARPGDRLGRWGGEEFVILCPGTDLAAARALAEVMRLRVAQTEVAGVGRRTCSFGVAERSAGESVDGLLARADAALYAAKHGGRDRVEAAQADPAPRHRSAA